MRVKKRLLKFICATLPAIPVTMTPLLSEQVLENKSLLLKIVKSRGKAQEK